MKLLFLPVLALLPVLATGECPRLRDVPVMYDKNTFLCAIRWDGPGADYGVDACNSCTDGWENGYRLRDGDDFVSIKCNAW